MKKQLGFTMIELMIVIIIIGILATLGGAAYSKSLQKGRDTKRISDMQEIQKGFEMYYAANTPNEYGAPCSTMFVPKYFPAGIPTPPVGAPIYKGSCNSGSYFYCTGLERPTDFGNAIYDGNVTMSFVDKSSATHYCVQNVQ